MIQFKTPFGPVQAGHQSRKGHKLWDAPKGRGNPYGTQSKVVQLSRRRQPSGDTDKSISKRKHHRVLLGLAAVFLIMGITVMSLNIRQITVSGNSRYTKEELIERIFPGSYARAPARARVRGPAWARGSLALPPPQKSF